MQITMTKKNNYHSFKRVLKSSISVIFVFLFVFISSAILIVVKRNNLAFGEQIYYFVCVDSAKKASLLKQKNELLKNLGGAGVIYYHDDNYYLIANVYLSLDDAIEIKNNMVSYFENASILKVATKKIKSKKVKQIKSDSNVLNFVNFIYKQSKQYSDLQMEYLSFKIGDSEFLSKLISVRLKFEDLIKKLNCEGDICQNALNYAELFLLQLNNFLNNYSISDSSQSYVSCYFVGFSVNYIEFFNSL